MKKGIRCAEVRCLELASSKRMRVRVRVGCGSGTAGTTPGSVRPDPDRSGPRYSDL